MIGSSSVLGLITARGGSKGIPRKNLLELGGKSLLARTVDTALNSSYLDRVVISSDDPEIIDAARIAGCEAPFIRPAELANDDTPHAAVISHALEMLDTDYELFVLLQPTSPLRNASDIDNCIEMCVRRGAGAAVSVTEFDKNPGTIVAIDDDSRIRPLLGTSLPETPRQGSTTYVLNGAVFVCRTDWWHDNLRFVGEGTVGYVMPVERSVDIDSVLDVKIAELLLSGGIGE